MKVGIPEPLRGYTKSLVVEATGNTVGALLDDLDRRFPGIRFRIADEQGQLRRHLRIFINQKRARSLDTRLAPDDEVQILQALSGG